VQFFWSPPAMTGRHFPIVQGFWFFWNLPATSGGCDENQKTVGLPKLALRWEFYKQTHHHPRTHPLLDPYIFNERKFWGLREILMSSIQSQSFSHNWERHDWQWAEKMKCRSKQWAWGDGKGGREEACVDMSMRKIFIITRNNKKYAWHISVKKSKVDVKTWKWTLILTVEMKNTVVFSWK